MYYAKQIDPALQESHLFEDFPDNIAVFGNHNFKERVPNYFKSVRVALQNWETCTSEEQLQEETECKTFRELVEAVLPPYERTPYTDEEIKDICEAANVFACCPVSDEPSYLCEVLSIVTGKQWSGRVIRGSSQSDWAKAYYPVNEWTDKALSIFETEFFNEGSEWIIDDGDFDPESDSPLIIDGERIYCASIIYDDIRKDIAEYLDIPTEELTLYAFEGYYQIPHYKPITP